jgi:hypothetical protein
MNSVYIQSGHTVTLTQNEAVNDLHLNNAAGTRLALATFTLSVNGKLRAYTGVVGTIPGTSATPTATAAWITSTSGKISIVGNTRAITAAGEWGATNAGTTSPNGFDLDINLNPGQTVTANTGIKSRRITVIAGTLQMTGNSRLAPDQGVAANSDVVIMNGATVRSDSSAGGGSAVIGRTAAGVGGILNINSGGTLILTGVSPNVGMTTVTLNGTVEYGASGAQTLAVATNGGASLNTYTNLTLSGSNAKTLSINTTVNGTLIRGGTSTLALSTFSLTYGSNGTLEFAGSSVQTTGSEFPISGGPLNLTLNNPNGVTLSGDRTITGVVALTNGDLTTGANILTLGSTAITSGSGDVVGTVRRTNPATGSALTFNNAQTTLNFTTAPTQMDVTLVKSAPSTFTYALPRQYALNPTGSVNATVQLAYKPADVPSSTTESKIVLWRDNAGTWENRGGTIDTTDSTWHWVSLPGVTQFSNWTLSGLTPTAITLTTFSGHAPTNQGWIVLILLVVGALLIGGWALRRRALRG